MKKLLIILLLLPAMMFAENKSYVYCELVGTGKFLSNKVNVRVDFGQATSFWKGTDYLKDENGKKITFNSMVDAMNYMGKESWEFVQAYVVTSGNQNVYRWLLKREFSVDVVNEVLEPEQVNVED